ncbi:deoxyribose-phosphate aldolase [Halopenitus persicus]|uniref:deoxyribose-phosphate aldolase n=1 Tax=Halopenitus persicus TaxID=1048396 RepID=UPI000BBB4E0D|nr:deoxyribose-phosphate aldolase [Halopenitus persicus]
MNRRELAPLIDHTVLGPETTWTDVRTVLEAAGEHGMNACVPPCYLEEAAAFLEMQAANEAGTAAEVKTTDDPAATDETEAAEPLLATVIDFPHGQGSTTATREAAVTAWNEGADELDVVINVGRLKAGEDDAVAADLAGVVAAVPIPVKVIIETALLTDAEKRRACEAAVAADADMVKTSTGFADGGARVADVELMSEYLPVKASGGIGSYEAAMAMIEAGADRIGASSGVAILEGAPE